MARRLLIAGNWKMNLNRAESVALAAGLKEELGGVTSVDIAVCPPFVYLEAVAGILRGSNIALGAQNLYFEKPGAFTGEIAGEMLLDLGCTFVVLGHSERRHILGETDADVNRKVHRALEVGLAPIVCVGETLDEREAGKTMAVIRQQFDGSLAGLTGEQMARVVIAYEPVWAIGTGRTATPEQAEEVHADVRALARERFGDAVAEGLVIQYGGSVKPENAGELLSQPDIDGALVGGASLQVKPFVDIVLAGK